ncbi:MAG: hypothetical protein ABFS28_09580 [Bacteroidota bacterium]
MYKTILNLILILLFSLMVGCETTSTEAGLTDAFIIMAYSGPPLEEVSLERYREVADAGIDYLVPGNGTFSLEQNMKALDLAKEAGIKIIPLDMRLLPFALKPDIAIDSAMVRQIALDYMEHPALGAYFIRDEPGTGMYPALKTISDLIAGVDPGHESLCCLFPTYGTLTQFGVEDYRSYIRSFIDIVRPGLLAYDSYVLRNDTTLYKEWFKNLSIVREETRKAGIPFLVFMQSVGIKEGLRVPGRAEILWQVNTALAYGARGVGWFNYWTPEPGMGLPHVEGATAPIIEHYYKGMIDREGNPTEVYQHVSEVNHYLKRVDKVLKDWELSDVSRWESGKQVEGKALFVKSAGGTPDIVIGTFRKDQEIRLVISNASCEQAATCSLEMIPGFEIASAIDSINAGPGPDEGTLSSWEIKPGGAVILQVSM